MGGFGALEIAIIVLVVLLFFGAKRIPELARGIGQGIQEFRKASDDIKKEIDKGKEDVSESASMRPKKEEETENK
ncbi:MAG: twin-arginine translocase TatA/TatE family subunit [Balneolaceae bacterium]|nr:MAG: twin-arginine translocase TatA/TatE family subunit [Balneolaceae bacterium]